MWHVKHRALEKGHAMMSFLAWWAAAAIVAGSAVSAYFMHLTFRAH